MHDNKLDQLIAKCFVREISFRRAEKRFCGEQSSHKNFRSSSLSQTEWQTATATVVEYRSWNLRLQESAWVVQHPGKIVQNQAAEISDYGET